MKMSKIKQWIKDKDAKKLIQINKNEITYRLRETSSRQLGPEEYVRAYYIVKLIYELKFDPNHINVEVPWNIKIGRSGTTPRSDIVIYGNDKPSVIFELKSPNEYDKEKTNAISGQLFGVANNIENKSKLSWIVYSTVSEDLNESNIIIDYSKYTQFKKWEDDLCPSYPSLKSNFDFTEKLYKGMPNIGKLLETDVCKIQKNLHDVLWRGGTRDDNKIFFNLLKMILCKIYDEKETNNGKQYTFQTVFTNGKINDEKTGNAIQELYKKTIRHKNYLDMSEEHLEKIERTEGGFGKVEFQDSEILFIVRKLQNYSLLITDYDVLSILFESILGDDFKQSKGMYFTHNTIAQFIAYGLSLDRLAIKHIENHSSIPLIMDPSCGSGTFLIESMKIITNQILESKEQIIENTNESVKQFVNSKFDMDGHKHPWAAEYIYGMERNVNLSLTTKINMMMHGDGHVHIHAVDSLLDLKDMPNEKLMPTKNVLYHNGKTHPTNEKFDIIISNPPFSMKIDATDKIKYRNSCPILGKHQSEIIFIERWYQFLKPNGRLGVVLPENIFNTASCLPIRIFLMKYFSIKAIVSLPDQQNGPFAPHTGTKTSLLFAQKKENDSIKMWEKFEKKYTEEFIKYDKAVKHYTGNKTSKKTPEKPFLYYIKKLLGMNLPCNTESEIKNCEKKLKGLKKEVWVTRKIIADLKSESDNIDKIILTHTENIGYKRTKRSITPKPNDLFAITEDDKIDLNAQDTILKKLRDGIIWN